MNLNKEAWTLLTKRSKGSIVIYNYSPFQTYVLNLISQPPYSNYPDVFIKEVFFDAEWRNWVELTKLWFKWIEDNIRWHHELTDLEKERTPKYNKQYRFKVALIWSNRFGEMYADTSV